MTGSKNVPKDLQSMTAILQDFGILDYEIGVENHMLDFVNRYVITLIEDAALYSTHANKDSIDADDVRLAIELQQDKKHTSPPTREITATLSRQKNTLPLPVIRSSAGLRLPPDRHSLIACNFQLRSLAKKGRTVHTVSRMNVSNIAPTTPIAPRSFNVQKTMQTIKFSEGSKGLPLTTALSPMSSSVTVSSANSSVTSQILMPTVGILSEKISNDMNTNKRPHEEDDDYDN